jgi:hypothetical protein
VAAVVSVTALAVAGSVIATTGQKLIDFGNEL